MFRKTALSSTMSHDECYHAITKQIYRLAFHSSECSMALRSTKMCSVVLRPRLKPACSSLRVSSTRIMQSMNYITLPITFAGTDNNVMPRQLPHSVRFPFLGSLTINQSQFLSSGITSTSNTVRNRSSRTHAVVFMSAFSSFVVIVSIPAALPFFMFFSATFISQLVFYTLIANIYLIAN